MGACYDVNLKVRFRDEEGAKRALKAKIGRANEEKILYGENGLKALGFDFDNIMDLLSVFFCGWGDRLRPAADEAWLNSGFDASYGWESVMMDAFDKIAPFLEDGSVIVIYPDSDYDKAEVINGKAIWIH